MDQFFHDINKRLSAITDKQDAKPLVESEKWIQKAVKHPGGLHKSLGVPADKPIPAGKLEKATHSSNPKVKKQAVLAKTLKGLKKEDIADEGNEFSGERQAAIKAGKPTFKVDGKTYKVTGDTSDEKMMEKKEPRSKGTAFDPEHMKQQFAKKDAESHSRYDVKDTGYSKRYTRKSVDTDIDSDDEVKSDAPKKKGRPAGKAKDPERVTKGAWKHKGGRKEKTDETLDTDGVMMTRASNMSSEDIHDMEGSRDRDEASEYGDEGEYVKNELHTMMRVARNLEKHLRDSENLPTWCIGKLSQAKGMLVGVMDYIMSEKERGVEADTGEEGFSMGEGIRGGGLGEPHMVRTRQMTGNTKQEQVWHDLMAALEGGAFRKVIEPGTAKLLMRLAKQLKPAQEVAEKAVSVAQRRAAGIAHAAQKGEIPKSKLKGASKEMAKMAKGELHKFAATKEKGLPKHVESEMDEELHGGQKKLDRNHNGKLDKEDFEILRKDKKPAAKKKDKEEVDETTVAGSVAPVQNAAPKGGKGMQFGKGVYESMNNKFKQALTESITVQENLDECGMEGGEPGITIQASGEDAMKLMQLLKLAGLGESGDLCPRCKKAPCKCDNEMVDENSPDWPTDTETQEAEPNLRSYSGGLNGPKSTGQSTTVGGGIPNYHTRRQASMDESVELERSLFKLYQDYKTK